MNAADIYERLVRPVLFSLDPETAHHLALGGLRAASGCPSRSAHFVRFSRLPNRKRSSGSISPIPLVWRPAYDKNGVALPAWAALGFGFVEIGTVTAKAQRGNPRPRIFRYPEQQALINRLGFNNHGADVVAARLGSLRRSGRWPRIPVGINIGKSKVTPIEEAAEDYLCSFRLLHEFADYIVLNVSSPNTPGPAHPAGTRRARGIAARHSQEESHYAQTGAPENSSRSCPPRARTNYRDVRTKRHRRNHRDKHHAGSRRDSRSRSIRQAA